MERKIFRSNWMGKILKKGKTYIFIILQQTQAKKKTNQYSHFQTLNGKATFLYECVADQVMYNEFVNKFNLPNSFNSWFLVTELHVWMLMVRAMGEIEHGEVVRNRIVESMWTDVVKRVQKLVPGSRTLAYKQIEDCSREFQYAILEYDEGLMKDDRQLASAIWRRFFGSNNDNYENIELLIKYIRMNVSISIANIILF